MRKIVLALGASVIALTALQSTGAEAGHKRHFKWHKPYYHSYYHGYSYRGKCFWKKKKVYGHRGWYWKSYKVCAPYYRRYHRY